MSQHTPIDAAQLTSQRLFRAGMLHRPEYGPPPNEYGAAGAPARESDRIALSDLGRQLGGLSNMLAQFRAVFDSARTHGLANSQAQLDTVRASIAAAGTRHGDGFDVVYQSLEVRDAQFFGVNLEPNEEVEIEVTVQSAAQQGSLFLQAGHGASAIDLPPGESLILEISGAFGSQVLSFASGTSLHDMAAAIDSFSDETGVEAVEIASANATAVALKSTEFGSGEFVSVKRLGDNPPRLVIQVADALEDDPDVPSNFIYLEGNATRNDHGRDVGAWVNGQRALTYGTQITFMTQTVGGYLDLRTGPLFDPDHANATHPGTFLAAILRGTASGGGVVIPTAGYTAAGVGGPTNPLDDRPAP